MASKDTIGSSASDKADWSSAWEAVSRLAATQESLQEAERHGSMSILTQSASEQQERRSHGEAQRRDEVHLPDEVRPPRAYIFKRFGIESDLESD